MAFAALDETHNIVIHVESMDYYGSIVKYVEAGSSSSFPDLWTEG